MLAQREARGLYNLLLPGRFPVETMPALMRRASVLLVTLKKEEIFAATIPSKVQAYLSAGRPVLACLDGEGATLIQDADAGLSVPAQDAAGLAKAILQLYQMTPHELDTLGGNGHQYFMVHFEHEKLMDELLVILNSPSTQGSTS
jgi:glycosyltransferase involved in cell wall biosynthesis